MIDSMQMIPISNISNKHDFEILSTNQHKYNGYIGTDF